MRANDKRNFVEHLSWDEVSARIAKGAAAVLPIGAGAKEHGFHLPMNTDRIQGEELAARFAERFAGTLDVLIWPPVTYGYYPAFAAYAGSCGLSAKTFEATIEEIVTSLIRCGCKAVFVLDTGISTIAPVDDALKRADHNKVHHFKIYDGPRYKAAAMRVTQQKHGSHADELETSVMLVLAPDVVRMERAEASPPIARAAPGPLTPSDKTSPNYSRSGSFGDPTLATREKGEILLAAMMDDIAEQASDFLNGAAETKKQSERTS